MSLGHRLRVEGARAIEIGVFGTAAVSALGFSVGYAAPAVSAAYGEAAPVVSSVIKRQAFNLTVRAWLTYRRLLPTLMAVGKFGLEVADESGQFSNVNAGASLGARIVIDETRIAHIFRNKEGHLSKAT